MKYSEQTIREIRDLLEEFGQVTTSPGTWEPAKTALAAMAQNGAEDQRSAAGSMNQKLATISSYQLSAQTWVNKLNDILNKTDPYPEGTERELDEFLQRLKNRSRDLKEDLDICCIRNDIEETPTRDNPVWELHTYATKLDQIGARVDEIQVGNEIQNYKQSEKNFDDEMTYLAAVTGGDNTKITEIPQKLRNAKKELKDAQNELTSLENGRARWKANYEEAKQKTETLPQQIEQLEEDEKTLRLILESDTEIIKDGDIKHAKERYNEQLADIDKFQNELAIVEQSLKAEQSINKAEHDKEKDYPKLKAAALSGMSKKTTEEDKKELADYADAKEKEIRYGKALQLTEKLEKTIGMEGDAMLRTILFGRTEIKASNGFLGFGKRERKAGFPKFYLEQLEEGLLPAQKERLAEGRKLVNQIQQILPQDEATKQMLEKPFATDGLEFVRTLKNDLKSVHDEAKERLEKNPAYIYTQQINEEKAELSKRIEAFENQYKGVELDENTKPIHEAGQKMLDLANFELLDKISSNPKDTRMIDDVLSDHIQASEKLAELDNKLDELKERKETLQFKISVREQTSQKIRADVVKEYDSNYQTLKEKEVDAVAEEQAKLDAKKKKKGEPTVVEKPSDMYLKQVLNDPDRAGNKLFDVLESKLTEKIKVTKERHKAVQDDLNKARLELPKAKNDMKKYSFASYKAALHNAAIDVDRKQLEVNRFTRANEHLNTAQEAYNLKNRSIVKANEAFDKSKDDILEKIDEFKASFDKNKKPGHGNSDEYEAIKAKLDTFTKESMRDMSPQQLSDALKGLSDTVTAYQTKKEKQWRPLPSPQRVFRTNFSNNIQSFVAGQQKTLTGLGIDGNTWQAMREAKQNPPQEIRNLNDFAEKAESIRQPYDQKTSGFQSIVSNIKFSNEQKLTEEWEMSPEERKERIVNAMVNEEVAKKVYEFNPSRKEVGAQKLELETYKNQLKADIPAQYGDLINNAMKDAERNNQLTAGNIAHRKAVQDVSPRYRNVQNYELPPQMVNQNVNQNENARKINNPVMNQNH